jgi:hypothetical protein
VAASELYDFLATVTPDYSTTTLSITPQGVVAEEASKNQVIHLGVDGSEERISFNTSSIFYLSFGWNVLSAADSGTVFNFYNDSSKANAMQRSFQFNYGDGHVYVCRFASELTRAGQAPSRMGFQGVRLRVLGRVAD